MSGSFFALRMFSTPQTSLLYACLLLLIVQINCEEMENDIVTYEYIKTLPPEALLIDVREIDEVAGTGLIPNSINIPLGALEEVMENTLPDQFQKMYGREKPTPGTEVIFTCKSGNRAKKAAIAMTSFGYTNVKFYKGSWTEWAEKNKGHGAASCMRKAK